MSVEPVGVLQLLTRLNVGGPARHVLLLASRLGGYRVIVAAGRPSKEEGELSEPGVEVRRVPLRRSLAPATDVRALRAVRTLLQSERIGLVATHMAKAGAVGRIAARTVRPRPRTVHTFHGHVLAGYFSDTAEKAFLRIERRLAARTDALVAVSEGVRDELLDLGIGRPDQWRVIPVGLDLQPFLADGPTGAFRKTLRLDPAVPLVGIVGRVAPVKDVRAALHAVAGLDGVHLAVVGDGPERATLEATAEGLGLSERVHFTGWRTDVPAVLRDLDAVMLTSRNEGTPAALIEAAAAGKPVVATSVGGVPGVIEDGVTGLLVPPGDPEAVATALKQLLAVPGRGARLGAAARQRTAPRFDLAATLAATRDLYDELLSRS